MDNIQNKQEENKSEEKKAETMHPHHKMIYIVFFIVLFFVIAIIALVKYAPMGDTAGKAIDVLNDGAKCEDNNGIVTLSDGVTIETYTDDCKSSGNAYFATDYSCNVINDLPTAKKEVNICNYGCDGVVCKGAPKPNICEEKASYCFEGNLISFNCVQGESFKKITLCINGCDQDISQCNPIN